MIIKTKEFILRPARKSDLTSYHNNKKKDKVIDKAFIHYKHPYSLNDARKDLDNAIASNKIKDKCRFIIEIDKEACGEIIFENIIPKLSCKIGYWITNKHRNKGIVTKAIKLSIKYLYKEYDLRRIYANVRTENKSSVRVLEKSGFVREGKQRKSSLKYGKYFDDYLYAKVI